MELALRVSVLALVGAWVLAEWEWAGKEVLGEGSAGFGGLALKSPRKKRRIF